MHQQPTSQAGIGATLLSLGFRPFFLLAGIWAVAVLVLSVGMIEGRLSLPTSFDPVTWHHHELLFGYATAVIAGFLLTAVPNWTGRPAICGRWLACLVMVWIAGRAAVAVSAWFGAIAAAVDIVFLPALAVLLGREIVAGKNWRNLQVVGVITLLAACNFAFHAQQFGWLEDSRTVVKLTLGLVVVLIALIGGRVIPAFTRNWLIRRGAERIPAEPGRLLDHISMAAIVAALGFWAVDIPGMVTPALLIIAAACHIWRLIGWRGWSTKSEPLLWALHLAYGWIPVGLLLLALSYQYADIPESGALHALTAGAIGGMTLVMMARVSLGHTGRALTAGKGLTLAIILMASAPLLRILAALPGTAYTLLVYASAATWIAAFFLFLQVCGPMLLRPRVDR